MRYAIVDFVFINISIFLLLFFSCRSFSKTTSHEYQFLKRNYESQSTNFGIVSLPTIIEKNDYLSYQDDQGNNNILISNFGEKEYECFGSCFCDERKTAANIMSKRTIPFLLVSISSIFALEKAKSYFETKCIEELSDQCHLLNIESSVEDCSSVHNKEEELDEKSIKNEEGDEERRVYACYGNCVKMTRIEKHLKQFDDVKCKKLKQEGVVTILKSELVLTSSNPSNNYHHSAKCKFVEEFLTKFCKENSIKEYFYVGKRKVNGKVYPHKIRKKGFVCVGRNRLKELRNIRCRLIEPEPSNNNWKWRLEKFIKAKEEWDLM